MSSQTEARTQDIALFIGLKQSRTKDYLAELVGEGKIILKWCKQEQNLFYKEMTPDDIEDDNRRHKRHSTIQLLIYNNF